MRRECDPVIRAQLEQLLNSEPTAYNNMRRSALPDLPGVYLVTALVDGVEKPYYVGRTLNLRTRLYQHLMSNLKGSSLKRYMVHGREFANPEAAKQFILEYCHFRLLLVGDESYEGVRQRGILEACAMGVLQPKYGFYREH